MADVPELLQRVPLRPVALVNLIANVVIVVTGGAVRLTGSGLGCPTWPACTDESFVPEQGIHQAIEFGNRMIGVVVGLIALAAVLVAWRTIHRRLALLVLGGVVAQAVIGGISVRMALNPWTVGVHFLVSMGILAAAFGLWKATDETDVTIPAALRPLAQVMTAVSLATIVVGTIVTGSGPHAGDEATPRNGFDPVAITQAHTDLVFLFLGLGLATYLAVKALGADPAKPALLLVVLAAQGIIGFAQYFTGLPEVLVGLHMLGACLTWLSTLAVLRATRPAPRAVTAGTKQAVGV